MTKSSSPVLRCRIEGAEAPYQRDAQSGQRVDRGVRDVASAAKVSRASLSALVVLALVLSLAGAAAADGPPPRDLHQVGDHWTAWNPPVDFPAGATVYTIERGDTLWDLANRFYSDPYLWPQLWEQNRYILDAHWIYPGDPLLVQVEVSTAEEYAEGVQEEPGAPEEGGAPGEGGFRGVVTADEAAGAPEPLASDADVYCSGFVGELDEHLPYQLIGSEHDALTPNLGVSAAQTDTGVTFEYKRETVRYDLATGDVVYIDGGAAAGLDPGELLTVVSVRDKVVHPRDRKRVVGRFYRYRGRVRILSVQDETAIGEILDSCGPINVGDRLRPFEPQPVPLGRRTRMRPINLPVTAAELEDAATILRSDDPVVSMGQGTLVFIDRGAEDDVLPGDQYTIYRENKPGLPPVVLGEVAILSTEDHTALGRVLEARYVVYAGDRLERK